MVTPVSTATYLVSRLSALLGRREAGPSQVLKEIFAECSPNPEEAVAARVDAMGGQFCERYTAATDRHPGSQVEKTYFKQIVSENMHAF